MSDCPMLISDQKDLKNKTIILVHRAELPLCCPREQDPETPDLWEAHPRVYYPIEVTKQVTCVWCGQQYKLVD
jgi:uncharacterized Zn-finger protein